MLTAFKRSYVLVLLCFMLSLLACNCSIESFINQIDMSSDVVQGSMDPDDLMCMEVFLMFGYSNYDASRLCAMPAECVWGVNTGVDMPTPDQVEAACEAAGVPTVATPGPSNVTAPRPPQPRVDCSAFRLTSPLDGLPNGVATFYWDPLPGATAYSVGVYGEGGGATFGAGAGSTSTSGDVSQGAIGGGFSFTVQANALIGDSVVCSQSVTLFRESADNGNPPSQNGSSEGETPEYGPCGIRGCIELPPQPTPVILY